MPFEAALWELSDPPIYQRIAEKALHLEELLMNLNRIAVALKVDRTTVIRALRWIKGAPIYVNPSSEKL